MIPNSRPKLSDFHTLSLTELLKNPTLYRGTYLYSFYMEYPAPPPPPLPGDKQLKNVPRKKYWAHHGNEDGNERIRISRGWEAWRRVRLSGKLPKTPFWFLDRRWCAVKKVKGFTNSLFTVFDFDAICTIYTMAGLVARELPLDCFF